MDKNYISQALEKRIYSFWEKKHYFQPRKLLERQDRKVWCCIMPPPNANAPLHIGHAVFVTIEDILTRFWRMHGFSTLWLPGFDHAGFETQVVFDKNQKRHKKSLKREEVFKKIWEFTQKNRNICREQLKVLGASADWSREKFTLDRDIVQTAYDTFKQLYKDNLLYKAERVINWCTHHKTALSNLEVRHKEIKGRLLYIRYKIKDSVLKKSNYIIVATTRPETIFGDTAVAVHPDDERYKDLVGKRVILPLINREIPIIADKAIDRDFGTGAVKITPAHDPLDFEIAKRHNLPSIKVINKDGKITPNINLFKGLNTQEARQIVIKSLKRKQLLQREESCQHTIGVCYKCNAPIEYLALKQWFIKIKPLAEKTAEIVRKNQIKFYPKKYKRIFLNWMKEIYDWNISRQIIWGIRIPVYYCKECKNFIISDRKPTKCKKCQCKEFTQELDVFDTWFSSGQWPFAVLGYPKKKDFQTFFPTSVLETGWDILFFWVARMIMLSLYRTGKIPFRNVVLHGLVRDKDRQKMSKSRGNVIDPLAVVSDHGADALRMALVFGISTGSDIVISEEKIKGQRNFANKVWNASRFILMNLQEGFNPSKIKPKLTREDRWILNALKKSTKIITLSIKNYNFHRAAEEIYHFFWHKFCDKTIEDCKKRLSRGKTQAEKETPRWVLWQVLCCSLKLLHPF
ncbi:MAG: valine--tRNA ligase, partial [Candidatus Bathyarchaeota archaeon]|nr:valine--tRNA ligase [Candidatus Bathyarchaeota archaeon]